MSELDANTGFPFVDDNNGQCFHMSHKLVQELDAKKVPHILCTGRFTKSPSKLHTWVQTKSEIHSPMRSGHTGEEIMVIFDIDDNKHHDAVFDVWCLKDMEIYWKWVEINYSLQQKGHNANWSLPGLRQLMEKWGHRADVAWNVFDPY